MLRIERDRLIVVGDRVVEVPLGYVRVAAAVVGVGRFRIERDRLIVVGDRVVEVPLGFVRVAAVVVGVADFGSSAIA